MIDFESPDYPRDLEDQITKLEAEVEALRYERAQAGKRAMLAEAINEELKSELADCQARVEATKKILIDEAGSDCFVNVVQVNID